MMGCKKGMSLAINTAVVLVLAIMVLVFMVLFFTSVGGEFSGKIKSYFSYTNVDEVIEQCALLVDLESKYSYCCEERNLKFYTNGEKDSGTFTCVQIAQQFGGRTLSCTGVSC